LQFSNTTENTSHLNKHVFTIKQQDHCRICVYFYGKANQPDSQNMFCKVTFVVGALAVAMCSAQIPDSFVQQFTQIGNAILADTV
jgi:hypothetical protein